MNIKDEIFSFLSREFPQAKVDVKIFPSGSMSIDIRVGERFVTIQRATGSGFGVSEISDTDPGFGGHDAVFGTLGEVVSHLRELLRAPDKSKG